MEEDSGSPPQPEASSLPLETVGAVEAAEVEASSGSGPDEAEEGSSRFGVECVVCSETFRRLKRLNCGHSFCPHCLERIKDGSRIRCPYCRQNTELSAFGVGDLPGEYTGRLTCSECRRQSATADVSWCTECKNLLCKECAQKRHSGPSCALEPANSLGPVNFCIHQLDKFSAIHTKLTLIQKSLVKEYVLQLGEALERQLDEDLNQRVKFLKLEKQRLKDVFEMDSTPSPNPIPVVPLPNGPQFAFILNEVYKLAPTASKRNSGDMGEIPREGLIFNPFQLEKTVESFLKMDKFTQFSTSFKSLMAPGTQRNPVNYIGAGQLDNPCDLISLPDQDILTVTCIDRGLFAFKFSTGELLRVVPTIGSEQFTGLTYEEKHKLYLVSTLKHYSRWVVKLYDQRMKLRQEIDCPKEPRIGNNWYRWLCPIKDGRVLMTTGDQHCSAIWLLDLNNNRWKELLVKEGVTMRRAAFNPGSGECGTIYIPDMQGKTVLTFHLDTTTWELSKESKIVTEEFTVELPICVDMRDQRLVVGNWKTGNVIVADLHKCSSTLLTSVGPKELFSLHSPDPHHLAVLCKEKEVIEVYKLNTDSL